jgi:hypothetical protein
MKTALAGGLLLASITTASWAVTCLPVINNAVTVDGIVVGGDIGGPVLVPASCATTTADIGWAGVLGRGIDLVAGTANSKTATLFFSAHQSGGTIDTIYFAVHVEKAPDFTTNDKLTVYFAADPTQANWDVTKDFALVFDGIGPGAGTPSNDGCTNPGGQVSLYKRDAGNTTWVQQGIAPATIKRKTSFAYNPVNDPQFPLWELEIGIDVSGLNIVNGAQIGLGAKLYLYEAGIQAWTAYHYPGVPTDGHDLTSVADNGLDFNPNLGGVTPSNLDKVTVGNCTFDVVITSIMGSDDQGNPGQFTLLDPNSPTDFDQNTGAAKRQNQFTATVTFVNPAKLGDTSTVAVANSGNVALFLLPWNGGFTDQITMTNVTDSFIQLGQPITTSIKWPMNKSQWHGTLNVANHACFDVKLSGFTVDLPNGNEMLQNLAFVSASTIKTSFLVAAPKEIVGIPEWQRSPDGRIEYILRVHWDNLAPKFLAGNKPFKYRITNASTLALKSIGKGYYSIRLKPGEEKRVMLEITGGVMPHPNVQYKLSAKAGGELLQPASGEPPLEIPVKPGSIVSILARGLITTPKHPPSDANGYREREPAAQQFLLRRGFYRPEDHVGAVIASCDKFHSSFVVGNNLTFAVPAKCEKLLLAVNYVAGLYADNKGEFELNVVVGDPVFLPARLPATGSVANEQFGIPAQMQPGSMLPQLVVDVGQRFNAKKFNRLIPTGDVRYAVYESHP